MKIYLNLFSFITTITLFNIFCIIIFYLGRNNGFIKKHSSRPIFIFFLLIITRLLFPIEFNFTKVIGSEHIMTKVYDFLSMQVKFLGIKSSIISIFFRMWILGIFYKVCRLFYLQVKTRNYLKFLKKNSVKENKYINMISGKLNIKRHIELYRSDYISEPFVSGVIKGEIYIPNYYLTNKELDYIISHELNHFKYYDGLKKVLMAIVTIIFWWNPFMYLLYTEFENMLEIQCDIRTTNKLKKSDKVGYLETIISIMERAIDNKTYIKSNIILNFSKQNRISHIKQRLNIVAEYNEQNVKKWSQKIITIFGILVFIFSYLIIFQPHYSRTEGAFEFETKESFILQKSENEYVIYIEGEYYDTVDDIIDKYRDLQKY